MSDPSIKGSAVSAIPPGEQTVEGPCQATPFSELRRQIMDSNVPKNEREWWAHHKIGALEKNLAELPRPHIPVVISGKAARLIATNNSGQSGYYQGVALDPGEILIASYRDSQPCSLGPTGPTGSSGRLVTGATGPDAVFEERAPAPRIDAVLNKQTTDLQIAYMKRQDLTRKVFSAMLSMAGVALVATTIYGRPFAINTGAGLVVFVYGGLLFTVGLLAFFP